jgi:hypothetical protein
VSLLILSIRFLALGGRFAEINKSIWPLVKPYALPEHVLKLDKNYALILFVLLCEKTNFILIVNIITFLNAGVKASKINIIKLRLTARRL